jgi:hypothetical protein
MILGTLSVFKRTEWQKFNKKGGMSFCLESSLEIFKAIQSLAHEFLRMVSSESPLFEIFNQQKLQQSLS